MKNSYIVPEGVDEILMGGKVIWERKSSEAEDYNDQIFKNLDLTLDALENSKRQTGRTKRTVQNMMENGGKAFLPSKYTHFANVLKSQIICGSTLDDLVEKTRGLSPGTLSVDPTVIWLIYRNEIKKINDKINSVLKTKE
ncbi:hypothetical protein [Caulobacter phage Cr30]|uniref:hypothetical protein n=1 Tax=Caulobacter phage Cr30 TaxID=1357714 RepID=UPI0004A9B49B|nr:hypothetical protein OZ74_gp112 [Caulobacter phage Cr30]AGS80997.1 hypothetical protein [Caulobacter phage Cr30]